MKFTLSWLKEHLDTTATVDEIAEALTDLGLEVEGVENPAARLHDFTIGKVLEGREAPRRRPAARLRGGDRPGREADRLRRAERARRHHGRRGRTPAPTSPASTPRIQVGKIRGIESHGMMCSEREMELSEEHDGIIELPSGEVGERFTDWLAKNDPGKVDPVIEIAITPNRQDALGVHGIARDLAARGIGRLIEKPVAAVAGGFPCPISVTIDDGLKAKGCPHFAGRLIRGVTNGPSPQWLQDRLKAIGLRPISALVDITNFFTYDRNRPLHVFDADMVKGGLRIHPAKGGEVLRALDGKDYTLATGDDGHLGRRRPRKPRRHHGRGAHGLHRGDGQRLPRVRLLGPGDHRHHGPARSRSTRTPATASNAAWTRPSRCRGSRPRRG